MSELPTIDEVLERVRKGGYYDGQPDERASDYMDVDVAKAYLEKLMAAERLSSEIWEPYTVYPFNGEYEVSSAGRVRRDGKILKQSRSYKNEAPYLVVTLSKKEYRRNHSVHRLVAQTFLINSTGKRTVNHKDGNRQNNVVNNLEWATYQENERHAWDKLGKKSYERKPFLTDYQVQGIWNLHDAGLSNREAANVMKVGRWHVDKLISAGRAQLTHQANGETK